MEKSTALRALTPGNSMLSLVQEDSDAFEIKKFEIAGVEKPLGLPQKAQLVFGDIFRPGFDADADDAVVRAFV